MEGTISKNGTTPEIVEFPGKAVERDTALRAMTEPAALTLPAGLLAELRRLDQLIAACQSETRGLMRGFILMAGVDPAANVEFDVATGIATVTPAATS